MKNDEKETAYKIPDFKVVSGEAEKNICLHSFWRESDLIPVKSGTKDRI
jgi:hypothetical protein